MKIPFLRGLTGRMLLLIGAAVLVGLTILTMVVTRRVTQAARADALALARQRAEVIGDGARARLDGAMTTARTLAQAFKVLVQTTPQRATADAMLRQALTENLELLGVWSVWEANAFDGRDADFVNKPGHDATGRYVPNWNRASGAITVEANKDYTVSGAGDYYLLPKATNRESVIEPYAYKVGGREMLMTSLVVPIQNAAGAVVGAVGIDIALGTLGAEIGAIKLGERGYAALVSNRGLYVAHPRADRAGKPMVDSDAWVKPYLEEIQRGEAFLVESFSSTLNDMTFRVAAPVVIGRSTTPWVSIITLPEGEVLASAIELRNHVLITASCVLLGVLIVVAWLARSITRPIHAIADTLQQGADQVAAASIQVSSAGQSLAEGASGQAAALEETSASCEEMAGMTKRNAEHAANVRAVAAETRAAADAGATDMRALSAAMTELKDASAAVAKIVKTIDEIAFQTNILALNAAVEAARAGEAGAGFAVVAEEVRSLAQRSAVAAKETAGTIETTIAKSAHGFEISGKVATALDGIVEKARRVDELVDEIATASTEQNQGIGQINKALGQMDKSTQGAAATAEETASASEEMSAQAMTLKEAVEQLLSLVDGRVVATKETSYAAEPQEFLSASEMVHGSKSRSRTLEAAEASV